MLRLPVHLLRRSSRALRGRSLVGQSLHQIRCLGISRHAHERWNDDDSDDSDDLGNAGPVLSPDDMEFYQYNPSALYDKYTEEEAKEEEERRQQQIRDELDSRTGRGWTDPWEITDNDMETAKEFDDLPDWTPSSASKISLDRVQVYAGGIPTLTELADLALPPPPPPHPSSKEARLYASERKEQHYKYVLGRVSAIAEPKVDNIKKLATWEEKQDAVDELFENVEFQLKEEEEVLGRHPSFGSWVETALEEYLGKIQTENSQDHESAEAGEDEEAVPIFIELFDKNDIPEGQETAPKVPKILHPLKPHHKYGEGRMVEEWELAAHEEARRIMLRQSTRQIARIMNQNEKFRLIIEGEEGVGKSAALLSIVACARKSGYIVLFVPDGDRLRRHGYYLEPHSKIPGLFDLPLLSQEICTSFLESHKSDLEGLSAFEATLDKYLSEDMQKRMTEAFTNNDLSLVGLLEIGSKDEVFAPMCYSIVIETLMNQTEKPFLIALDEFNCYFDYGQYYHMDYDPKVKKPIPLGQISLFKPLLEAANLSLAEEDKDRPVSIQRGGIIVAISESKAVARKFTDAITASASRQAVVENSTMHIVTVPRYSKLEVEHVLSNFDVTGIGRLRFDRGDTVIDEQEGAYLRMLSGSNGQLLLNACIF